MNHTYVVLYDVALLPFQGPNDELQNQVQELTVTNVSSLPLTTQLSLPEPFSLIQEDESACPTCSQTVSYTIPPSYRMMSQHVLPALKQ